MLADAESLPAEAARAVGGQGARPRCRSCGEMASAELLEWLREAVANHELNLVAVFRKHGTGASWPITAKDPDELEQRLAARGHFVPLPKEPAALANVLEVSRRLPARGGDKATRRQRGAGN